MTRKQTALLLSGVVFPGLGQLYLGRKLIGTVIIVLMNLLILLALFVILKGLSPVIAAKLSAGAVKVTAGDITAALGKTALFAKSLLVAFLLLWSGSIVDIARQKS